MSVIISFVFGRAQRLLTADLNEQPSGQTDRDSANKVALILFEEEEEHMGRSSAGSREFEL